MARLQLLLAASLALFACASAHWFNGRRAAEGDACRPYGAVRTCGNRTVISDETTQLMGDGVGENVCETVTVTQVQIPSFTFQRRCRNCRLRCLPSDECDGPMLNNTNTKRQCCEGFTTSTEETRTTYNFFHYLFGRKTLNCTVMLRDTVLDCLTELGLDSFVEQVLLEPELEEQLNDAENDDDFTLFVPSDEAFESLTAMEQSELFNDDSRRAILESHIREGALRSKRLVNGLILQPLTESTLLHVSQIGRQDSRRTFVNGVEIEIPDACQARNGIVHVVNSIIPVSPSNIAEILSDDDNVERFGIFELLLNESGILPLLNRSKSRTVFVPTNDAFQDLPAGAVDCLLREENSKFLNKFVLIHISFPALYTSVLIEKDRIPTFTYYYLTVRNISGEVRITRDEIALEEPDITARNGVIHVINEVIDIVDFETLCPDLVGPTTSPTDAPTDPATGTTGPIIPVDPFLPPGGTPSDGPELIG